jgi:hypothetical protein
MDTACLVAHPSRFCVSDSAVNDSANDGGQAGATSDSDTSVYARLYCWREYTDSGFCSPTPRKALAPAFGDKVAGDSDQESVMYVNFR